MRLLKRVITQTRAAGLSVKGDLQETKTLTLLAQVNTQARAMGPPVKRTMSEGEREIRLTESKASENGKARRW